MKSILLLILILPVLATGQETAVKRTPIYTDDTGEESLGSLDEGTVIKKLRKTKDGKFIRATLDFYIPVSAVENADVYANLGTQHMVGTTRFRLQKVARDGNRVRVYLDIRNDGKSNFKFTAAVLTKLNDPTGQSGDLNPFEGRHQGFIEVKPRQSITAELVFDFKKIPGDLVFSCKEKMTGEELQYFIAN